MMEAKQLLNQFKKLDSEFLNFESYLNYSDDNEFGEEKFFDRDEEHDLYYDMFNVFIQPIIERAEAKGVSPVDIIFDSFSLDYDTKKVIGVFYEPDVIVQLEKEDYKEEISEAVALCVSRSRAS